MDYNKMVAGMHQGKAATQQEQLPAAQSCCQCAVRSSSMVVC